MPPEQVLNVPNLLTLSRLPLTVVICAAIAYEQWTLAFVAFVVAALTDWLDGWWARRFNQGTAFGRVFDPLTDKVMILGAFVFLIDPVRFDLPAWIVAVVLGRELIVTGLRGYLEGFGIKFGADWFGKLKTVLQCVALGVILGVEALRANGVEPGALLGVRLALVWAMLLASVGSGLQYVWKAARIMRG